MFVSPRSQFPGLSPTDGAVSRFRPDGGASAGEAFRDLSAIGNHRGVVLPAVFLVLIMLGALIFAYHSFSRSQAFRLHHGEISESAGALSLSGARFLANVLQAGSREIRSSFRNDVSRLFGLGADLPETVSIDSGSSGSLRKVRDEFQRSFLDPLPLDVRPVCEEMRATFREVSPLHPTLVSEATLRRILQSGRDGVEKKGRIELSCSIRFPRGFARSSRGIARKASIVREFRIVSMIPGPYARFTLFAPYTPHEDAFNVVSSDIRGVYSAQSPRRLILINGPDPLDTSLSPSEMQKRNDPSLQLARNGWVFLGPPGDRTATTERNRPVFLKVPSGYDPPGDQSLVTTDPFHSYPNWRDPKSDQGLENALGGNIYLSWPANIGGTLVPAANDFDCPGLRSSFQAKSLHFGWFSTAHSPGIWFKPVPDSTGGALPAPLESGDCLSSWIMPFGTRQFISRTLVFGKVLADFLRYVQIISRAGDFQGVLTWDRFSNREAFDPGNSPKFVYKSNSFGPQSYASLLTPPYWNAYLSLLPTRGNFPVQKMLAGIPFNLLFDMMNFGGELPSFLEWKSREGGIGTIRDRELVPGVYDPTRGVYLGSMNEGDLPEKAGGPGRPWRNILPTAGVQFWLSSAESPQSGRMDPSTYFSGNLLECRFKRVTPKRFDSFVEEGLLSRVTHRITIRETPGSQRGEITSLLEQGVLDLSDDGSVFVFRRPGIYLLERASTTDFDIPKPILLEGSGILILENGNFRIGGVDVDERHLNSDGTSPFLFSLVALDGHIKLPPAGSTRGTKPVHAFLAALNPLPNGGSGYEGGGILALKDSGRNISSRLFVSGGVAAFEVADSSRSGMVPYRTMFRDFAGGGIIRYNPVFNPSAPPTTERYQLVTSPCDSVISISGDEK